MARLKNEILEAVVEKTGLSKQTVRNNISKLRRDDAQLTPNAAAQIFLQEKGKSFMTKLDTEDRQSLAFHQQAKTISNTVTYNTKHDHRNVSLMGESFNNLIIGDNNQGNTQQIGLLDEALNDLLDQVSKTDNLSATDKNDIAAEIGTIVSQSKKTNPDKDTISKAWTAVSVLANIATLAGAVAPVGKILVDTGLIK